MKIHKGDKVKVIAGKDKGKSGVVLKALPKKDAVVVEGINIVSKHVKPGSISKEGGIVKFEKAVHVSNVVLEEKKAKVTKETKSEKPAKAKLGSKEK